MATLSTQKRIAADILKVGESRIWIDPKSLEDVAEAVTREDVKKLIKRNVIQRKNKKGNSRGRYKRLKAQRDKGRRKGPGSRKGTRNAREPSKDRWIKNVRAMRRKLRELRDTGKIDKAVYREYYGKIKGGVFRNTSQLVTHLKDYGILKGD